MARGLIARLSLVLGAGGLLALGACGGARVETAKPDRSGQQGATMGVTAECRRAARQRDRVAALLREGRLDRTVRVIRDADRLCPQTAKRSRETLTQVLAQLGLEPPGDKDGAALLRAAQAATGASAQALYDRARVALERATDETAEVVAGPGYGPLASGNTMVVWLRDRAVVAHGPHLSVVKLPEWEERRRVALPSASLLSLQSVGDGRHVVLALDSGGIYLVDADTGTLVPVWTASDSTPTPELAVHPTGEVLAWLEPGRGDSPAGGERPGHLVLWDVQRRALRARWPLGERCPAYGRPVFSKDGSVAQAPPLGAGGCLWTYPAGRLMADGLLGAAENADGRRWALLRQDPDGGNTRLLLWNASTGQVRESKALPDDSRSVAMSPNGRLIAVGSFRLELAVFDATTLRQIRSLQVPYCAPQFGSFEMAPRPRMSRRPKRCVRRFFEDEGMIEPLWGPDEATVFGELLGETRFAVFDPQRGEYRGTVEETGLPVQSGGETVFFGPMDPRRYRQLGGKDSIVIATLEALDERSESAGARIGFRDGRLSSTRLTGNSTAFAESPDGSQLVAITSDGRTTLLDAQGAAKTELPTLSQTRLGLSATRGWWSGDGRWLAVGFDDNAAAAWDTLRQRQVLGERPRVVAVSLLDDRLVAHTNVDSVHWTPPVGPAHSSDPQTTPRKPTSNCQDVRTPDARRRASLESTGDLVVYEQGQPARRLGSAPPRACPHAFSADGSLLAVAAWKSGSVRIIDVKHDAVAAKHEHDATVSALGLSQNGKWAASVGSDGTLHVWNVATGSALWERQVTKVYLLLPADDGQQVVTYGADGVGLWEPRREIELPGRLPATALAFSDDGRRVAAGTAQGEVVLWRVRDGERLATFTRTPEALLVWGPNGEYEVLSEPADAAGLRCRIGTRVYPLRLCSERFEVPGLAAALLKGDTAIFDP